MPNHIANLITLRGDEKRIAEVREQLRYQEDGLGSLDFNKLIPMPKSLEIEEGSNTTNAIRLYVTAVDPNITWLNPNHKMAEKDFLELQKALDGKQPFPSYDALLARISEEQIPSLLELGKQAVENQQQYGEMCIRDSQIPVPCMYLTPEKHSESLTNSTAPFWSIRSVIPTEN